MDRHRRKGSLIGPVILVGLGVVFLLVNLGRLPWSVWEVVFRLWPALLIAAGLDILIGRRSAWGSLLAVVLMLAVLGGALWLSAADLGGRDTSTETIRQVLGDATHAEVTIARGAGAVHLEALPLSASASLLEGVIPQNRHETIVREFAMRGDTATLALRTQGQSWEPFVGQSGGAQLWDLKLNRQIPLDLQVSLGAGRADVDMTSLTVRQAEVSLGVGQVKVVLPDAGRLRVKISGAVGETTVVIPEGLEARIDIDAALVSRHLPSSYRRHDNVYISPGYERADRRVDLEVSQAIGSIAVRHAQPQ
jgi:hypothetical protein